MSLNQLLNLNPSKLRLNTKPQKSITAMKNPRRKEMTISTVKFIIVVMRRMIGIKLGKTSQKVPKMEHNQVLKRNPTNKEEEMIDLKTMKIGLDKINLEENIENQENQGNQENLENLKKTENIENLENPENLENLENPENPEMTIMNLEQEKKEKEEENIITRMKTKIDKGMDTRRKKEESITIRIMLIKKRSLNPENQAMSM